VVLDPLEILCQTASIMPLHASMARSTPMGWIWSLLKRGISGTYLSVQPFHRFRYLDEQAYRYNPRDEMDDFGRFRLPMFQIVHKRLTWNQLTGKE
jgi:hypothetical protein